MNTGLANQLPAPEPELDALSFAQPEPESVGQWISRLPMANISESAGQIRQATFEIARLDTDFDTRMRLLEGIRPTVHYLATRLDKAASSAGNQADAISRLAQRLQTNLCSGYRAVVVAALETASGDPEVRQTVSLAIHRSLAELSRTLLRTLQYYVAPADRLWLKLNQLYLLAEELGFAGDRHPDPDNSAELDMSITGTYLRSLLLALAQPYQLRHRQLSDVFAALPGWVHMASLVAPNEQSLYVVDLSSDHGPEHARNRTGSASLRGIQTDTLVYELDAYLKDMDGTLVVPPGIDVALLAHLAHAWGEVTPRAFRRHASADSVRVSIGMRSTHYFMSGGVEFQALLGGSATAREINPFATADVRFIPNADEMRDVWEEAPDVGGKIPVNPNIGNPEHLKDLSARSDPEEDGPTYRYHDTTSADISPAGYRLRWNEPFPPNLQAGDLIGLRDESDPRWCLGVVRWLRLDDDGPHMGVKLLAPQGQPVAVRLVRTRRADAQYQRAFLLPELKPIGQPATLLVPPTPYQRGQKVHLWRDGTQHTAQLGDCLLKTESFKQFTFRLLDGYLEKPGRPPNMNDQPPRNNNQAGFR